jgi:hypothetical protein
MKRGHAAAAAAAGGGGGGGGGDAMQEKALTDESQLVSGEGEHVCHSGYDHGHVEDAERGGGHGAEAHEKLVKHW